MYDKFLNKNNIWETLHYKFPVAKSSTTDPDLERAVMIDQTIKNEETARINEDIRINQRVDKEIEDRIAADEILQNAIDNEINERIALSNKISSGAKSAITVRGNYGGCTDNRISYIKIDKCIVFSLIGWGYGVFDLSFNDLFNVNETSWSSYEEPSFISITPDWRVATQFPQIKVHPNSRSFQINTGMGNTTDSTKAVYYSLIGILTLN